MDTPRVHEPFGAFGGGGQYRPSMTAREKAMFAEMTSVETILADALGLAPHERLDQTITTLALVVATVLAEQSAGQPGVDTRLVQATAEQWAAKIEHWLATGNDIGHSPDYEAGFRDGWTHAAMILRSLFAGVADNLTPPPAPDNLQYPASRA